MRFQEQVAVPVLTYIHALTSIMSIVVLYASKTSPARLFSESVCDVLPYTKYEVVDDGSWTLAANAAPEPAPTISAAHTSANTRLQVRNMDTVSSFATSPAWAPP